MSSMKNSKAIQRQMGAKPSASMKQYNKLNNKNNIPKRKPRSAPLTSNVSGNNWGQTGFGYTNRRAQIVEEDEFITDLQGSEQSFASSTFPINPGQSLTFPWLSKVAALYEKYEFLFLEFYYRREVSEFSASGTNGKVILSCDYDASDPPPASKQNALDTYPHSDGMPCDEQIVLRLDPKILRGLDNKFVRPGLLPFGTDIKTYDGGTLAVSIDGTLDSNFIGELHVRYRVKLSIPVLENAALGRLGGAFGVSTPLGGEASAASGVYKVMFSNAAKPKIYNNSLGALLVPTGLIVLPVQGLYRIFKSVFCANTSATNITQLTLSLAEGIVPGTFVSTAAEAGFGFTSASNIQGFGTTVVNGDLDILWNTQVMGLTVSLQAAATFAAGFPGLYGYLNIQLIANS